MTLVNQPTSAPTRKMTAVIVAGALTAILQTVIAKYLPDFPATQFLADFDVWAQAVVMMAFGYFTKERSA